MKLSLPFLLFANIIMVTECQVPLSVLGLIPFESGAGAMNWTNLAVSEINAREDILPNFHLRVLWVDSDCRGDTSLLQLYVNFPYNVISIFGLPCIDSTIALAEIISALPITMFTHSPYIPDDSDPTPVVNGFPSSINAVIAQLKFISDHSWTRVATINYDSLLFSHLAYELQRGFYRLNITNSVHSISSTLSADEYTRQIDSVISTIDSDGFRVVVFNMFQEDAEYILCRMHNTSIDFEKYTIILPGFIHYDFSTTSDKSGCDLQEIVTGAVGFIQHPRVDDIIQLNYSTPINLANNEVLGLYMYDSMWALALALNDTDIPEDLPFYDTTGFGYDFLLSIHRNILKQSFRGLTGDVLFNGKLRVSHYAQLVEFTPNGTEFRGLYTKLPTNISQIGNLTGVMLTNKVDFRYWDEMRTDGVEDRNSSYYIFYAIIITSVLALVYIVVLISIVSFGLCKRFPPAVKSEPAMSIFILASSGFWLALAVLLTIDGKFYPFRGNVVECTVYCHLLVWLGAISTSFILGGVLAKSIKLYSFWVLNKFQKNYKLILRFRYLVLLPISLAVVDTIIILFWAGLNPIEYTTKIVRSTEKDPPFNRIAFCEFKVNIPLGLLLCIKVIVIFLSIFLAYHLRKVTNKSQRYTFVISLMVYTTLFFSLFIIFIMGYVSNFDSKIGLASSFCVLASLCNASIIGLPIIYYMYRDPRGKCLFNPQACDEFPEDTDMLRKRIEALQNDIERMKIHSEEEKQPEKKDSTSYMILMSSQDD